MGHFLTDYSLHFLHQENPLELQLVGLMGLMTAPGLRYPYQTNQVLAA